MKSAQSADTFLGGKVAGISDKRTRILVVDDNRDLADVLQEYLLRLGYEAVVAYGGREGLELFKEGGFDIVISDLKMPDLDGMELLKAVKAIDKHAVVLVITAYGTIDTAVEAIKYGAYDFISKPFDLKALEIIVERSLERQSLYRRVGRFRRLILILLVSVPVWLILGILLAHVY